MNRFYYVLYGFVIINCAACKKNNNDTPHTGKDIELTAQEQQKVSADNQFSFNLFKNIAQGSTDSKNLFISPLSVSIAVGMLANGSNGQTKTDIYKAMNFNGFDENTINGYYSKLINGLPKVDEGASINIANSIWYDKTFNVLPQFLQTNTTYYNSEIQSLDFKNSSAVPTINNWVNTKTKGKIPTIIDAIPDGIIMYLINAIYFKDQWEQHFDASKTHQQAFYLNNNSTVQSNFMRAEINIKTGENDLGIATEIPYAGKKFSMVVLQPQSGNTLSQLIAGLDTTRWNDLLAQLKDRRTIVTVPKFKFSYKETLNTVLKNMGMSLAFSDNADLSRINGGGSLKVSEVKHKAFIEVNEDGTEAAAVTSIGIELTSAPSMVTLDHPFIFVIREVKTGLILFTGIVNNPNDTGS